MLFTNRFFSPKQNNSALKKNRNPVGFNKGHPCGVSGTAQQPCNVILGLAYRQWLERCCVRPELLFFSSNRFLKDSADQEMSRAGIRFLRMLLPSGNSRVSLNLNRIIRALFHKRFSRGLFCGGSFRALFRRDFYRALFRGGFSCALFRTGFSRGLFCRGSFRALFCRGSYRALFCRGFFRVLFRRGFSVHSFAGAFPVASFAGALTVHSFVGAFSERCFAGAFSVRSFKLEFRLNASFEWIDMLDASFLKFFSIIARVLDQFWASLRGNQHIRDWINWNWNHQKKRPEAWHRIKSY